MSSFDAGPQLPESSRSTSCPALTIEVGSPQQSARLRKLLQEMGYTEAAICERVGCVALHKYRPTDERTVSDVLDVLIRLFLDGEPVTRQQAVELVLAEALNLLEQSGLLQTDPVDNTKYRAPLALYPLRGIDLVSDFTRVVVGTETEDPPEDAVFPATTGTTSEFLNSLPTTPCDSLLDIGAGTGVGALLAATRYARHSWAIDITERATQICQFNAQLNGIGNVTALTGDLYEPVADKTFDRIISHPPYVPKPEFRIRYRDGGVDGEDVIRRIIGGLPRHLRQGGQFCCRCMATDRKGTPLEQRVREMIGAAADEFDVAVITNLTAPPGLFYCRLLAAGTMSVRAFEQQLNQFHQLSVEHVVIGFIYIERHRVRQDPVTVRRHLSGRSSPGPLTVEWLLEWERAASYPELPLRLIDARPLASTHAEVLLSHRMREGELWLEGCQVTTSFPFAFTQHSTPGTGLLLGSCDGTRTTSELYEQMKELHAIPPDQPLAEFVDQIRVLIGGGVLTVEEFPLPAENGRGGRGERI